MSLAIVLIVLFPLFVKLYQNQQVKQEEHGPGYLFQACVLPRFPAGKKSKIFLLSLATEK